MNHAQPLPVALLDPGVSTGSGPVWGRILAIAHIVLLEMCRRKDFYVLFILTALITVTLGSARFFGEADISRYLKEVCLQLIWIASLVIAITSSARQIPSERDARTLFPLLAKPVTRDQLMTGKFLGCWMASGLALTAFYGFFVLVSGFKEGSWPLLAYFQAAALHWFMLGIVISMTLLGSIVLAAPSSNCTITFVVVLGILLTARHLNTVALGLAQPGQTILYAVYFAIPHLELFDARNLIIHDWGVIPWMAWAGALIYALVYSALFLKSACLIFRRKPVN